VNNNEWTDNIQRIYKRVRTGNVGYSVQKKVKVVDNTEMVMNEWCDYRLASSDPGSNVVGAGTCTSGCCILRDPFRVPERERDLPDEA